MREISTNIDELTVEGLRELTYKQQLELFNIGTMSERGDQVSINLNEELALHYKVAEKEIDLIPLSVFANEITQLSLVKAYHFKRYLQYHYCEETWYVQDLVNYADKLQQRIKSSPEYQGKLKVAVIESNEKYENHEFFNSWRNYSNHRSHIVVYPAAKREELLKSYTPRSGSWSNSLYKNTSSHNKGFVNPPPIEEFHTTGDLTKVVFNRIQDQEYYDDFGDTTDSVMYTKYVANAVRDADDRNVTDDEFDEKYCSYTGPLEMAEEAKKEQQEEMQKTLLENHLEEESNKLLALPRTAWLKEHGKIQLSLLATPEFRLMVKENKKLAYLHKKYLAVFAATLNESILKLTRDTITNVYIINFGAIDPSYLSHIIVCSIEESVYMSDFYQPYHTIYMDRDESTGKFIERPEDDTDGSELEVFTCKLSTN